MEGDGNDWKETRCRAGEEATWDDPYNADIEINPRLRCPFPSRHSAFRPKTRGAGLSRRGSSPNTGTSRICHSNSNSHWSWMPQPNTPRYELRNLRNGRSFRIFAMPLQRGCNFEMVPLRSILSCYRCKATCICISRCQQQHVFSSDYSWEARLPIPIQRHTLNKRLVNDPSLLRYTMGKKTPTNEWSDIYALGTRSLPFSDLEIDSGSTQKAFRWAD
jgi:hypothetical protein